ncbi:helix-turn-helix transcriptional regulator [Streptomyces sp. yr375]|uniref:helix-turn-helix domain-containing protein n=1 Tax=Streptomyces sp. yr375 TaxID=1761906 RepID=UPI000B85A64B|nr:helix-turn-helix transcriptional regulator [Streptomyces sp. yr375]
MAEEIAEFAALLRELKQRSGLSYEALAKRAHMSTSTLHRYCKGEGVPADHAAVSRFARVCRATPEELIELHRSWILADAARERARRAAADPEPTPEPNPSDRAEHPSPDTASDTPPAPEPEPAPTSMSEPGDPGVSVSVSLPEPSAQTPVPARRTPKFLRTARMRWSLIAAGTAVVVAVTTAVTVDLRGPGTDPTGKNGRPAGTVTSAGQNSSPDPAAAIPLTVATRTYAWDDPQCEGKYLINRPPGEVSPPVMGQDVPGWVKAHGAIAADGQRVALTVQGTGDETVVIESLHVRVVNSGVPPAWNAYLGSSGCGGGVETRSFATDLDAARPTIVPKAGQRGVPYKVSQSDPEVLYITARASVHDVNWYVELEWSSGGRQGTIRIDDHGKPFRTSGSRGRPVYEHLLGGTEWFRVADNSSSN